MILINCNGLISVRFYKIIQSVLWDWNIILILEGLFFRYKSSPFDFANDRNVYFLDIFKYVLNPTVSSPNHY